MQINEFVIPTKAKPIKAKPKESQNNIIYLDNLDKKKSTICFATMCKNEALCIRETLESVYKYIDYWVVGDTGSTDETCKIVEDFFREKNIPGELHVDEWKGFDHNKTLLFNYCYLKADYILHVDADDLIVGDFKFETTGSDKISYNCWVKRNDSPTKYKVQLMFNNHYHWKFCGVAHTTIKCLEPHNLSEGTLCDQDFYLNSRDFGNRGVDPEKYYKDALKLKTQFYDTLVDDPDGLNYRSVFYTANSYKDAGKLEEAARWYSLYLKLKDTWVEEQYISYLQLTEILRKLNKDSQKIIKLYKEAIKLIPDRAEAFYSFGQYLNHIKNFTFSVEILKIGKTISLQKALDKYLLFINQNQYEKYFDDELSVSYYWLGLYKESIEIIKGMLNDDDFKMHKERLEKNMKYSINKLSQN
jgi:tetratricopeptide (TPR) repeat protein